MADYKLSLLPLIYYTTSGADWYLSMYRDSKIVDYLAKHSGQANMLLTYWVGNIIRYMYI